jgi:hypothetical protein
LVVDVNSLTNSSVDQTVYRIIQTRYPQIDLFERVAFSEQWDILFEIESLTNPRLRDDVGDIHLIAKEDRSYGEGSSWIMAAFTHPPKKGQGGRFNRDFGIYYCAPDEPTAISETSYHRARFLRDARIDSASFEMRVLRAYLGPTTLHDIRGMHDADIYHSSDYAKSQIFGAEIRHLRSAGIHYRSVRCEGECFAIMRPKVLSNAIHWKYLKYFYEDGAIVNVTALDGLPEAAK